MIGASYNLVSSVRTVSDRTYYTNIKLSFNPKFHKINMNIATQTMSTATLHSLSIPDYCIIMQFMTFDWFCNQGT